MKGEEERTPLRTILENFLNHIEKLDSEKLDGSYDKEFQELKLFSELLKTSKQYSCSQGEKEVNRKKNRYKDILPFDCSRVVLEDYAGIPGSDYINANYIKGASGSPAYIASQGPLPHTVNDFWRMVVQCEVQVIVMACNEEEAGKHKCENYWVEHEGEEKQFGMVAIQLIKASVVCPDFLVRTMRLKYTKNHSSAQEERTVCQFHYSAWPDHGVPPLVRPLLDMVRLVRDTQASETLPVLVHCSAGCGRTGTICAIDYVWGLLRAGKLTKDFSLFKLVREMRKQRIAMVQTKEQYVLVHHAVKELFNEQLRMIDSHPYENIDVNGMVKDSPEPVYATITSDNSNEEKQDSNKKESNGQDSSDAPPLPRKRKPYTAHTKQEKEVENLTEKQRSSGEQIPVGDTPSPGTSSSGSSSILHKPRIAKLRALFERTSSRDSKSVQVKQRSAQQVTRSYSLGAVRKVEEVVSSIQPIPNKGILRVPQLTVNSDASQVRNSRPALPIKRSKSLKVLSSGERSKFSVLMTQMDTAHDYQCRNSSNGESTSSKAFPHPQSSSDKSVKDEIKPYVPPKKNSKSKIGDKRLVGVSTCSKPGNYQNFPSVTRESYEDKQTANSCISTIDCWKRRSLDSLPLENDSIFHSSTSALMTSPMTVEQCKLDLDAQKVVQKCNDYLLSSAKCEATDVSKHQEQKFQDSVQISHLQHLTFEAQRKVNAVVGGLGTRERRNSFRRAISKDTETYCRAREYDSVWVNNTAACVEEKEVVESPCVDAKVLAESAQSRTMFFSNKAVPCSSQSSTQRVRPGESQRIDQKSDYKPHPSKCIDDKSSRAMCSMRTENLEHSGFIYHNDIGSFELQRISSKGSAENCISNISGAVKVSESVETKGKIHSNSLQTSDSRCATNNSVPSQSVLNSSGFNRHASCDSDSQAVGKLVSASVSAVLNKCGPETPEYRNFSRPMMRRVTTGKGPTVLPSPSGSKQPTRIVPGSAETSGACRPLFNEIPHSASVAHHGAMWAGSSLENQTGAVEDIKSGGKPRHVESYLLASKMNAKTPKVENSPKQDVLRFGNQSRERTERLALSGNSGASRPGAGHIPSGLTNGSYSGVKNWNSNHPQNEEQRLQATRAPGRNEWQGSAPAHKLAVKLRRENTSIKEGTINAQLHHGSQDDLALCMGGAGSSASSRVRRHASVVLLRHSLIETNDAAPLAVWNASQSGIGDGNVRNPTQHIINKEDIEAWNGAPGVDVDMVAASIKPSRDNGTPFTRALEAFHLRKPSRSAALSPPQQRKVQQPQVTIKKQHYL